jgi:hypothetical protein
MLTNGVCYPENQRDFLWQESLQQRNTSKHFIPDKERFWVSRGILLSPVLALYAGTSRCLSVSRVARMHSTRTRTGHYAASLWQTNLIPQSPGLQG